MSYLETEIDETLENLCIENAKFNTDELKTLITNLCNFFFGGAQYLDPKKLKIKHAEYNPKFWQEVSKRIHTDQLILIVVDTAYRAWSIEKAEDIENVLSETTGYPFWITDKKFSFLIYMDDHDCVSWA
ncbi:hypothetical protein ACW9IB_24190 [Pseudomonas sp. SDO524_S393]